MANNPNDFLLINADYADRSANQKENPQNTPSINTEEPNLGEEQRDSADTTQ
jgi:hypothetical protein